MVLSLYGKQRIIYHHAKGFKAPKIAKLLKDEGIKISRVAVHVFLIRYRETGSLTRRKGSSPPRKVSPEIKEIVEQKMQEDDETTASQLQKLLTDRGFPTISCKTILRCRTELGWTFRGSAYCQLIRDVNKAKRLEWARQNLHEAETGFQDVVWTDESSIQMETHKRYCYRKIGQAAKSKPRLEMFSKADPCCP